MNKNISVILCFDTIWSGALLYTHNTIAGILLGVIGMIYMKYLINNK